MFGKGEMDKNDENVRDAFLDDLLGNGEQPQEEMLFELLEFKNMTEQEK